MDHLDLRGGDLEIDLESGDTINVEDWNEHQSSSSGNLEDWNEHQSLSSGNSNEGLDREWSEFVQQESPDASAKDAQGFGSFGKELSSDELFVKSRERLPEKLREEVTNFAEKRNAQEKPKMPKAKWPPRPPRPPGGPSLDPADMKLVKEISELAILKRKRAERRKALQKMRKDKPSSTSTNLLAWVVTALFFLVIIFQGFLGSRM